MQYLLAAGTVEKRPAAICNSANIRKKKARNWVQCNKCLGWWHCICANITHKKAGNNSFQFSCIDCKSD